MQDNFETYSYFCYAPNFLRSNSCHEIMRLHIESFLICILEFPQFSDKQLRPICNYKIRFDFFSISSLQIRILISRFSKKC
jgi:hypothetical protein